VIARVKILYLVLTNCFERVLAVVDDALSSAADTKSIVETDQKFEGAIKALSVYEQKYHPK
jgi:hypothetical protein